MKKLYLFLAIILLTLAHAGAQAQQDAAAAKPAPQRLLGEVTAVDAAAHQVTVRADSGETVALTTSEQTTYTRMPPGETDLKKGERVTFAEVHVGDRVLAPNVSTAGGAASRLILMARAAAGGGAGGLGRDAGRRLNGRVVSVDASKKLIVVQTRGRVGQETVTVDASAAARVLRFAPDSTRPSDAVAGSLADVRAGDTLRATGDRSADGASFKAEEVLTGAFTRFMGTVASADAQRGELVVKNEQTGQNVKLSFGARSSLRRITPEVEQAMERQRAERAERMAQRRAAGEGGQPQAGGQGQGARREGEGGRPRGGDGAQRGGDGQGRGEGGGQRRGGGGGGFQQMFDNLPAVTLAELKKGDAVIVTATPGADATRATVVTLVTGSAEVLRGMQQFQRGPDGQRGMSPGLPGDVMGNGQGPTREPPR